MDNYEFKMSHFLQLNQRQEQLSKRLLSQTVSLRVLRFGANRPLPRLIVHYTYRSGGNQLQSFIPTLVFVLIFKPRLFYFTFPH